MPKWIFQKTSGDQQGVCLVSKTGVKIIGYRVVQGEVLEIAPLFNEWQIEIAVTAE